MIPAEPVTSPTPVAYSAKRTKRIALGVAAGTAALCVVLQATGLDTTLRFDREAIDDGRWWLLLTGNFVHLGASHLLMNIAGLGLVTALVWKRFAAVDWLILILGSSVVVGVGLWWRNPELFWYVGFSGTLHGLIIAGTLADLRVWPRSAAVLLVAVAGKLAWEQLGGALPGSESFAGGNVIVDAHLYGALGGALIGIALILAGRVRLDEPEA